MTFSLTRRNLLRISLAFSLSGLSRIIGLLAQQTPSPTSDPLVARLAEFFLHKESAKIIGIEYLRCVPAEADVNVLVKLICSSRSDRTGLVTADAERLRTLLVFMQRRDFAHDRIVKIQGWILSETEARLCALAAIV